LQFRLNFVAYTARINNGANKVKALIFAAALIGLASAAQAKDCPSIYSKGYTFEKSGDIWVNSAGAKIGSTEDGFAVNGKAYGADVSPGNYFYLVEGSIEKPSASYKVVVEKVSGDFVSPDIAKLTGGSATFVRKCK
jgi:hypothetical protein